MKKAMRRVTKRRMRTMITFKLKRRKSGKFIKQDIRKKELAANRFYENKGAYRKNNIEKRHVENPTIYKGEEPLKCALRNIRVPKKCRKTAWKRFEKAFPNIKVDKKNKPHYHGI